MGPETGMRRLAVLALWAGTTLVVLVSTVLVFRRGLVLGDEGYILGQSLAIADGKVPYRDLDMFVAPGVWLLNAGLFKAFGPSVLISRIPVALCYLLTVALACWVVTVASGPVWATAVAADARSCIPAATWRNDRRHARPSERAHCKRLCGRATPRAKRHVARGEQDLPRGGRP